MSTAYTTQAPQATEAKRAMYRRRNHANIEAMQNYIIASIVDRRTDARTQDEIDARLSFEMPPNVRNLISALQGSHGGGQLRDEEFSRSYLTLGRQLQFTGTEDAVRSRVRAWIDALDEWQYRVGVRLFTITKGGDYVFDGNGKQLFHADGKTPVREATRFIDHLKPVADDHVQLAQQSDLWKGAAGAKGNPGRAMEAQSLAALSDLPQLGTRAESGAVKEKAEGLPKGYERQQAGKIVEAVKARAEKIEAHGGNSSVWVEELVLATIEEEADKMETKGQDADLWLEKLEAKISRARASRRKTAGARLDYGSLTLVEDEAAAVDTSSLSATNVKGKTPPDDDDPPDSPQPPLGKKNLTQYPAQTIGNQPLTGAPKMESTPNMLEWALFWASQGVPVFPVYEVFGEICTCSCTKDCRGDDHKCGVACKNKGKHPRYDKTDLRNGQDDATCDREQITKWWTRWPDANIGGVMGGADVAAVPHRTRLLAVDVDPRNGGNASLADLCEVYGLEWLDRTLQHKTGGGGLHFFFVVADGEQISKGKLGPGLDVKWKGYVLLPPSLHASGLRYEINLAQIAHAAPDWLLERLSKQSQPTAQSNVISFQEEKERRHSPGGGEGKEKFHEGDRNDGLFAVLMGRLRWGWADNEPGLHEQAREINQSRCVPPLDEDEVCDLVAHVFEDYSHLNGINAQGRTA